MNSSGPLYLLLISCFLSSSAIGQLNSLSTFEEMSIVRTKFDGIDGEAIFQGNGFGAAKNYTVFSKPGKHQATDLLKIIADTPFLSFEVTSNTQKAVSTKSGDPRISLQPHPWDSLNKLEKGNWSILVKSGSSHFLLVPLANPSVLEKELSKKGGHLSSDIPGLENINIQSIRIENGNLLKGK